MVNKMQVRMVRFSVDADGKALFPDVFFLTDADSEFAVTVGDTRLSLVGTYSMHSRIEEMPQEIAMKRPWEWDGFYGDEVPLERWLLALEENGNSFKHNFPREEIAFIIKSKDIDDVMISLWSSGDQSIKEKLIGQNIVWVEKGKLPINKN